MQGIDESKVGAWLIDHIDGLVAPFTYALIAGGRSNLTFRVTDAAGRAVVVRRPPLGHVLATAHDMAREYRIIAAVGTTSVPVPPALGLCVDEEVNGAPFYVMDWIDGVVLDRPERADLLRMDLRPAASAQLIDCLADLHAVDPDAVGLGDLGRREGYIERQVRRWSGQWELSKTHELPAVDEVAKVLATRLPQQHGVAIAHGDYRFGNVLLDPSNGRLTAILDWELCTLGDPLADVGYLGVYWEQRKTLTGDVTVAPGFSSYSDLLARYATRTGRDLSGIDFYVAFGCWRLAVICEGVYARYVQGKMGDQHDFNLPAARAVVDALAERALALVRGLG